MPKYEVELTAQVWTSVEVEAANSEEAAEKAYEALGDVDYEVDFTVSAVWPEAADDAEA